MARTTFTARKCSGGMAPRKQLSNGKVVWEALPKRSKITAQKEAEPTPENGPNSADGPKKRGRKPALSNGASASELATSVNEREKKTKLTQEVGVGSARMATRSSARQNSRK